MEQITAPSALNASGWYTDTILNPNGWLIVRTPWPRTS